MRASQPKRKPRNNARKAAARAVQRDNPGMKYREALTRVRPDDDRSGGASAPSAPPHGSILFAPNPQLADVARLVLSGIPIAEAFGRNCLHWPSLAPTGNAWLRVDEISFPGLDYETVQWLLDDAAPGAAFWMDANTPMYDPVADLSDTGAEGLLLQVERTGKTSIRHVGRDDDPYWHPEAWTDNGYVEVIEVRIVTVQTPREVATSGPAPLRSGPTGPITTGYVGQFTDHQVFALDKGRVWMDGQVRPITDVSGPGFLGWIAPPDISE